MLLGLLTLGLFWQSREFAFLNFDDDDIVTANPAVLSGLSPAGVRWAFTTRWTGNWHPLTWLSHMLDVELFGSDPGPRHLENAALHAASAGLLMLVLMAATGALWRSLLAAVLFAVHPLRAESVAWIAERKDVLSVFFLVLVLAAWARYARRPSWRRYAPVALLFGVGLTAKPMLVVLPGLLLFADFWPLGRFARGGAVGGIPWRRLVVEKCPLIALAGGASVMAFLAQRGAGAVWNFPLGERIANAALSYVLYLGKTLWPAALAVHYPHRGAGLAAWQVAAALLLLGGITAWCLRGGMRRPFLVTGWLWFLGALVPVIGVVQVGTQGMADRYMYVPHVGLFLAVSWWLGDLAAARSRARAALAAGAAVAVAALSFLAWRQISLWRDDLSLFSHVVAVQPSDDVGHSQLGGALAAAGRSAEAAVHYRLAFELNPLARAVARLKAGREAFSRGALAEARVQYLEVLRILPPGMKDQIAQVREELARIAAAEAQGGGR